MQPLAAAALRHPRLVLLLIAAATLGLGAGVLRLETAAGYRALLGDDHPVVQRLDAFTARFGGGLPFAAVWSCDASPCESVFDAASLAMAADVAGALRELPGVLRVDSPATTALLVQPDFGLPEARRLAPEGRPVADAPALARRALADPLWVGHLVSPDGRAGAVIVQLASSEPAVGTRAVETLRRALAPWEARGFVFSLVGGPVEFVVAGGELADAAKRLVPIMVALVALALLVLFRAPAPAALALGAVGVAVLWTAGLQGWLGWPETSLTQALPPLVLVIGVCDAVHLLAAAAVRLAPGALRPAREDAFRQATAAVGGPCLMTTLTTAAGLASFAVSGLESIARFGLLAAFGVVAALLLSFTLLPIAAVRVPPRLLASPPAGVRFARGLEALLGVVRARAPELVAGAAVLSALSLLGLARLEVDARFEDLYGERSLVVRWVRTAATQLREPETLEIGIELPPGMDVAAPEALAASARVEALEALPGLGRPLSLRIALDALHRVLHDEPLPLAGDGAAERAARMLRLLRAEEPDLVRLFADREGGALRVSLQAEKLPQSGLRELLAQVDARLARELPPGFRATVTGPLATVNAMIEELRTTQLRSFALAAALVFVLVAVFFRSPLAALLALVPTLLPVGWTLGAMGALGIRLDVGSAMVAAVVLGLAVDDAIHLLTVWRRRRVAGEDSAAAAQNAVREVGRALVSTSLALAVGFAALSLAPWGSIASFGAVSALAILAALAAVLVILPALLLLPARRRA